MKNSKRIASVALSSALILSSTVGVFAKDYDLIDKNANKTYEIETWTINEDLLIDSTLNSSNYILEVKDKKYALNEIMAAIGESDKTPEEVVGDLEPVEDAQGELKVESVSAINKLNITVTFEALTEAKSNVTIPVVDNKGQSVSVKSLNLAKGATSAKFEFTTALAESPVGQWTIAGKSYNVDAQSTALLATKITPSVKIIDAVIGTTASVQYTVTDKDGKGLEGVEIEIAPTPTAEFKPADTDRKVYTTDANGVITHKFTSIHPGSYGLTGTVVKKPLVRNDEVSVNWAATENTIAVQNPENKGAIINTGSPKESVIKYTATFIDEKGQPVADGETVYVNLKGATHASLTAEGKNEFDLSNNINSDRLYPVTLSNGDGTAVLEFSSSTAGKITPVFYYAGDDTITALADFKTTHAKRTGAEVEVLDGSKGSQKPVFTIALKEGKDVNKNVKVSNGEYNVDAGSDAIFTVTAKDQYGNPFIGEANLSNKVALDDIASNDSLPGKIQFGADEEDGATFTTATTADFAALDTNQNGVIEVKVKQSASQVGDTTNLVVWFDNNNNNKYEATEGTESAKITFVKAVDKAVTSMKITADKKSVAANGTVVYSVDLLGADGKAFDASATNQNVIVKLFKDGKAIKQSVVGATEVTAASGATLGTVADDAMIGTIDQATGKFTFTVTAENAAGFSVYPVVYVDVNGDGVVQSDETVKVQGEAFAVVATPDKYKLELSETNLTAGDTTDIKITALKSGGTVETNFTGKHVATVLLAADTGSAVAADKTYLREANFVNGVATITVPVEVVANADVKVTMPVGTTPATDFGTGATDTDLTIKAAAASKLIVDGSEQLFVVDSYGNTADYDFAGLAKVTSDNGTFGVSPTLVPDAEGNAQIKIVSGEVFASNGTTNVTFDKKVATEAATLKLELANGNTFEITLKK